MNANAQDRIDSLQTADLSDGWWLNLNVDGTITIRSPDRGQRINLSANSAKKLWLAMQAAQVSA